jgi:hypothetical protein
MTGSPNGDEKTGSLTKTEKVTVSQQGTLVDLHCGIGSGKKMALTIVGKIAFHIL